MKSLCKRTWEVEALADGRVSDKDRASFERHTETCADCTHTLARLREVGTLLAEVPVSTSTELEHRRARAALLTRANDSIVGVSRPRRSGVVLLSAVIAFAAIVLVVFGLRPRSAPVTTIGTATTPVASPLPAAVDSTATAPLVAPTGSGAVAAAPPNEVPAGPHVVEPRLLKTEAASAAAPTVAPSAAMATASPSGSSARGPALAGERFARAMSAFSAGDYGEADRAFVAFVRDFPADSRAEDAMFLVADARARRGDSNGARIAARAYLQRFPSGLRAPAAERLAADPR